MTLPENLDDFFTKVMQFIGATPTPEHLEFFSEWARNENTTASFNPLATTLVYANSTPFNSSGVQDFASESDGIFATGQTLLLQYYTDLISYLKGMVTLNGSRDAIVTDINTWGTHDFATELEGGWVPEVIPLPTPVVTPPSPPLHPVGLTVDQLNIAYMQRLDLSHLADGDFDTMLKAWNLLHSSGLF